MKAFLQTKKLKLSVFLASFFFLFGSLSGADAATVYIDPSTGTVTEDGTFVVRVRLDNEGGCINAASISLSYPPNSIRAVDVGTGNSIFTLWVEKPHINEEEGVVAFTGGIPGGYCGRIPGDPGLTNVLASIAFQPPAQNVERVIDTIELSFLDDSQVFLNDGWGTEAPITTIGAEFGFGVESTFDSDEWLSSIREDVTPPAAFEIELLRDDSIFRGRYFIIFSTTDKGSGISHFEVKESDIDNEGFLRKSREEATFQRAESPYLLKDQTLNSVITVKAVDKAGNERLSTFVPDESMRQSDSFSPVAVSIIFLVILLAVGAVFLSRFKKKRKGFNGEML